MKKWLLPALLMLCGSNVLAQQTPVKATVIGPNTHVWANGTAHASLVCPGNAQAYIGTTPIARDTPTVGLDGAGVLRQTLYDTSFMVDVSGVAISCQYVYRITEQCGIANFSTNPLTGITGLALVDLTSQVNATSVNLSPQCDIGGGISGVNWFLNNVLVGTEPGGDVVQGSNQVITATDDPSHSRVHYTFNATGGGTGITPCSAGMTYGTNAPFNTEAVNTLTPSGFNNGGSWGVTNGWLPFKSSSGGTDLCTSLFWQTPGITNDSPFMASATTFNRTVAWWGPAYGMHIETCNGLNSAGYSTLFPPDAGCVGAVGSFVSFYNITWSNISSAFGNSCADALGNASVAPSITCADGNSNSSKFASTGVTSKAFILTRSGTPVVSILPPASGSSTFTMPTNNGTAGQVLSTDGAGNTSWSGTVPGTVQASSITTIGSNVGISANTLTTVMTKSVVMPSSGCPCRAFVSYSIHLTGSSSQVVDADVSDATNRFAQGGLLITGSHSYAAVQSSSYSTGTYANGAVIVFTLEIEVNNSGESAQAAANFAGFQNTWLNVAIMTSN